LPGLGLEQAYSWTGAHDFSGAVAFSVGVSSDVSVASTTGGLWLSAGHTPVVSPSVSNGDVLINASNGAGLFARATPGTNVGLSTVELGADGDIVLNANSGIAIVAGSGSTGFPVTAVTTGELLMIADGSAIITAESGSVTIASNTNTVLGAGNSIDLSSPTDHGNTNFYSSVQTVTTTPTINDLSITAGVIRFTGSGAKTLTGMVPHANANGHFVLLVNASNADLTMARTSGSSSVANQFAAGGTQITIPTGDMGFAWYDNSSTKWRVMFSVKN
jgi:hypothetical protein